MRELDKHKIQRNSQYWNVMFCFGFHRKVFPFFFKFIFFVFIQCECAVEETVPTFELQDDFKTEVLYPEFVF